MSLLPAWMSYAPPDDEGVSGTGVGIKEEISEDVTEEICVEIKEEIPDYADEVRNDMNEAKIKHEFSFCKNLQCLVQKANEKVFCHSNLV